MFYITGSDVGLQRNNAKGTHCFAYMATLSILMTLLTPTVQREHIVAFTWQLWLRERPAMLRCRYIVFCGKVKFLPVVCLEDAKGGGGRCIALLFLYPRR